MTEIELFQTSPSEVFPIARTVFIDFDGGRIAVVLVDGEPHPILRTASDQLGLKWSGQHEKIQNDPAICVREIRTQMPGDDQARAVLTTDLDGFGLWLAKLNANKVAPEARDVVITWQRKAARAIRDRFFARAADATVAAPDRRALAVMVIEAEDARELAERRVAELVPIAAQAEQHRAADGQIAVGDFANKLKAYAKRELGVRVMHREVWDFLGRIKLIVRGDTVRHNHPTAFAIERDFVRAKESEHDTNHGREVNVTPRLTPAGEGWAWDRAVRALTEHGHLHPTSLEKTA